MSTPNTPSANEEVKSPVQVVVNQPTVRQADTAMELDLVAVFKRMGQTFKKYIWLMVCLAVVGLCVPLVMYGSGEEANTVATVVSLDYMVTTHTGNVLTESPVTNLTAPDGRELDLATVTSSYVLQQALDMTELSADISIAQLQGNLTIEKILSEDSRRQQEVVSRMLEDKNSGAYQEALDFELEYTNQFVVTLANGFGNDDSSRLTYLDQAELKNLLDNIIASYNSYLYDTYYSVLMPDDELSKIDLTSLDLLEGADKISTAMKNLIKYFDGKPQTFLTGRSAKDGLSMNDMKDMVQLVKTTNVDYIYSYILTASLSENAAETIMKYNYELRNLELELEEIEESIATTQAVIETYQNDQLSIAMQEGQGTVTAQSTTDYYNSLVVTKAELIGERSDVLIEIADISDRIEALTANDDDDDDSALIAAREELTQTYEVCTQMYNLVLEHAEEMASNDEARTYVTYTAAQGETTSFVKACAKNAGIGAVVGLFIAIVVWGCAALGYELGRGHDEMQKEAA